MQSFQSIVLANSANSHFDSLVNCFTRSAVTALLVGLAVLGHAPGWYHAGCCPADGNRGCRELNDAGQSCCEMAGDVGKHSSELPDVPCEHPESCSLCQSLAMTCGVSYRVSDLVQVDVSPEWIAVFANSLFSPGFISSSRPRGPPALF